MEWLVRPVIVLIPCNFQNTEEKFYRPKNEINICSKYKYAYKYRFEDIP